MNAGVAPVSVPIANSSYKPSYINRAKHFLFNKHPKFTMFAILALVSMFIFIMVLYTV